MKIVECSLRVFKGKVEAIFDGHDVTELPHLLSKAFRGDETYTPADPAVLYSDIYPSNQIS